MGKEEVEAFRKQWVGLVWLIVHPQLFTCTGGYSPCALTLLREDVPMRLTHLSSPVSSHLSSVGGTKM